jgi:peptidyl-tRNA hydrolase, PTH2 family
LKQVIVVDDGLRLPPGKLAAQVAHASVGSLLGAGNDAINAWLRNGMPKVVLRCEGTDALLALEKAAADANLPHLLIRDAGRTTIAAGTTTCLGIGPASEAAIDAITGSLKLLR